MVFTVNEYDRKDVNMNNHRRN